MEENMKKFSLLKNVETITSDNSLPIPTKSTAEEVIVTPELLAERYVVNNYGFNCANPNYKTVIEKEQVAFLAGYNARDTDIDALVKMICNEATVTKKGFFIIIDKQSILDVYTRWKEIGG